MKAALVVGVLLVALGASSAMAAPPTSEQKTEFHATCMSIARDETLCSCKAQATDKLIDSDFMTVVIASMRGKTLDPQYAVRYNDYVAHSNQICKPSY